VRYHHIPHYLKKKQADFSKELPVEIENFYLGGILRDSAEVRVKMGYSMDFISMICFIDM
jgi:hypothetical protein